MSDPSTLRDPEPGETAAALPPDAAPPSASPPDPPARRPRHDAFTETRKREFLEALLKEGSIADACRRAKVAPRTVYRHQEADPRFLEHCNTALRMCATPIELTAWQRAVEGVPETVVIGNDILQRRRYSEGLLRMLLQGSNPGKYGPRPGFKRKTLLKHERKQMEREIRARIAEKTPSFDEAIEDLWDKLEPVVDRRNQQLIAEGWSKSPEGHMIPPGYAPIPGSEAEARAAEAATEEEADPRLSM